MLKSSFQALNQSILPTSIALTNIVGETYRQDESEFVHQHLSSLQFTPTQEQAIETQAIRLVENMRKVSLEEAGLESFLFQYDLSSDEGIALMCMAEALLRIPDTKTVDLLIRDKLTQGDWESYLGKSHSLFVNTTTWALMLTGKVLGKDTNMHNGYHQQSFTLKNSLKRLARTGGEPLIRQVVTSAMRILSKQFVMGRTIEEALKRALGNEAKGYRYSYDMLGEAAYTKEDAQKYFGAYQHAMQAILESKSALDPFNDAGISVKLSALHPKFLPKKRKRVLEELVETLKTLAYFAKDANMGFTIDAEEADTLLLLLEVFGELVKDKNLKGWDGLGIAVQAYQKRAACVLDWLLELSQEHKQKLMVRLVKGAYWDTEIKLAQVNGLKGYPVFTRKIATDVNYLHCVHKLLKAHSHIFAQFATHNAHTVASVLTLTREYKVTNFEFQCLHGMGSPLYDQIVSKEMPCRIYAPVGTHQDLLAYLVRRLLENGANTSFVNRIVDEKLPLDVLVANPITLLKNVKPIANPKIPKPEDIYTSRKNSKGIDLNNPLELAPLLKKLDQFANNKYAAKPTIAESAHALEVREITAPFNKKYVLGKVMLATEAIIEQTLVKAEEGFKTLPAYEARSQHLIAMADYVETHYEQFMALLILEGGKTYDDAVAEVREAIDFCRYYGNEALRLFKPQVLQGPTGEYNELRLEGRGIITCISPWNFPLAIFLGQVVASYVAGNCVIAKPASQTPLIAQLTIDGLHAIGVQKNHILLLPGSGSLIGDTLASDFRLSGIVFTGSTNTAWHINQQIAQRKGALIPFIAETGGQNAMVVDSTALSEQVVADVITSIFRSAGQRCSSLRVLYLQEEIFDKVVTMLKGAMQELKVGNPMQIDTDVGPVIDSNAQRGLYQHLEWLDQHAQKICQLNLSEECKTGTFVPPSIYEIQSMAQLQQENFGPILHVIKFARKNLDHVLNEIENYGYGLTLGIHSRIDETIAYITQKARVGNMYVNRNMIGAVVGVQPFGGERLSGTGPKAGGPHYITRLATERTVSINTTAAGGNASLMALNDDSV